MTLVEGVGLREEVTSLLQDLLRANTVNPPGNEIRAAEVLRDYFARDGIDLDRSTLADIVRRMQRKGLLQRRRTKEDARAYAVKLTEEGRRLLRLAEPLARRVDDRILEALPVRQREQFVDDLLAIVDTLQRFSSAAEQK